MTYAAELKHSLCHLTVHWQRRLARVRSKTFNEWRFAASRRVKIRAAGSTQILPLLPICRRYIIIIISYDITIRIMLYTDWSLCLMRLIWSASKFNNGISFTCQILLLFIFKILLITSSINPRNSYQYKWRNILWTFSTFL